MSMTFQNRVLEDIGVSQDDLLQGSLSSEARKVTGMFEGSTEQFRWSTASRALLIIARATGTRPLLAARALRAYGSAFFGEAGNEPADTDFLHDADPRMQSITREIIRGMMLQGSGLRNDRSTLENFHTAMDLNRSGAPVSFEIVPHTSELDPVFIETMMDDLRHHRDPVLAADAEEFLAKNVMVVGHKVFLSRMRRVFARTLRTLFTVAPKYRAGLQAEEASTLSAHSRAVGHIIKGLRTHAQYVLSLCPEGGRTVEGQIGMYKVGALGGGYRVPMFLDMPPNFLGLDAKHPNAAKPAVIQLTVGEPYQPTGVGDYVPQMHRSLQEAGAPVAEFAWGYKEPKRNAPDIDRRKGAPEVFTPIIPKAAF